MMIPLSLHSPLGPTNVFSGHAQMTVRSGALFCTEQVWSRWQGRRVQGSIHSASMQASLGGQSLSTRHSASTASGAVGGAEKNKDDHKKFWEIILNQMFFKIRILSCRGCKIKIHH